jgi:cystathionine beta-synthase
VFRRYTRNEIITTEPEESLRKVYIKMRENGISQLPVLDNDHVIGILDESDMLLAMLGKKNKFTACVKDAMAENVISIKWSSSENELLEILKKDYVAIVEDEQGGFYGIITKIDYLTYLELKHF